MTDIIKKNRVLAILTILVVLGVLIFNIFHYSSSFGIVEINNINSLFLVPFITLVCWLGMTLGTNKKNEDFEIAYHNQISEREKQVIELVSLGKRNQQIADELFVDISTVKTHINNIYKKTGIKNRRELGFLSNKVLEK
ncbi:LuxR C-terminal-related transcriptional regulator [Ekhidna sp.]